MGLLQVTGKIDLKQFWPNGESDADTTKVIVEIEKDAFKFQPSPDQPFTVTQVFEDAKVIGASAKQAIDKKGRISVRLQGIDAPELHYSPTPISRKKKVTEEQRNRFKELNEDYRQYLGETATVELHNFLSQSGNDSIPCLVTSVVSEPNEVFDTYARFVGDLVVQIDGNEVNVNRWLLQEGWAFPTFYSSMASEEIQGFINASKQGREKKKSAWSQLQDNIGKLNQKLIYRGKGASPDPAKDRGPLILPKLFRRLCTWTIYRKVGIETSTFQRYLADGRDACFLTEEFLEQGSTASTTYFLNEFIKTKGKIDFQPEDLVFSEKPSKLVDSDGKIITDW